MPRPACNIQHTSLPAPLWPALLRPALLRLSVPLRGFTSPASALVLPSNATSSCHPRHCSARVFELVPGVPAFPTAQTSGRRHSEARYRRVALWVLMAAARRRVLLASSRWSFGDVSRQASPIFLLDDSEDRDTSRPIQDIAARRHRWFRQAARSPVGARSDLRAVKPVPDCQSAG